MTNFRMVLGFTVAALLLAVMAYPAATQVVQSGSSTVNLATAQRTNPAFVGPIQGVTDIELLTNGGFESGTLTPWTTSGSWRVATNGPHSGNYCAYDTGNYSIMQEISPTPAAQIISATLWMRQPEVAISLINFLYQGGSGSSELIWPTASWAQYDVTSFITPGTIVVGLRIYGYSGGAPGPDETFLDDVSIQTAGGGPALDVNLTPMNPPIVIPPQGGQFSFTISVSRVVGPMAPFTVWARVKNPDGTYTAPTLGPVTINTPVGVVISRQRTQTIPASWPPGTYTYLAYANTSFGYPAVDSSYFSWTKTATAGDGPYVWEAINSGEPFPDEQMLTLPTQTNAGVTVGVPQDPWFDPVDDIDTVWFTGDIDQHIYGGQTLSWTVDLPQVAATRLKIKYGLWNSPEVPMDILVNHHRVGSVLANLGYSYPGPAYAIFGIGNYIQAGTDLIEVRARTGGEAVVGYLVAGYRAAADAVEKNPLTFGISPNPFNPTTNISFTLPEMSRVTLNVYDISGRRVAQLVNGMRDAGQHQATFDGSNLASGVYIYTLSAGVLNASGKMMLLK